MVFFLFALVVMVISSFTRALASMWIFNWYAPVIYPGVSANYMQALAALALVSALHSMMFHKHVDIDTKEKRKKVMGAMLNQAVLVPFITAALFGFVYICCVYPFTA
jgi:hypothetical protein